MSFAKILPGVSDFDLKREDNLFCSEQKTFNLVTIGGPSSQVTTCSSCRPVVTVVVVVVVVAVTNYY
jgi:hypothetical protein